VNTSYKPGNDPLADKAMQKSATIRDFCGQAAADLWDFKRSLGA
jgi:flagellar biosynthesis/type III secretory pathway ATPase